MAPTLRKLIWRICSLLNYYYHAISIFQDANKKKLKPASLILFTPDEQAFLEKCAYSFNYSLDYSRGFRQKELFTVQLSDVSFLGNSGAVILNNKVITESVFDSLRLTKSPAFRSPALLSISRKKGVYTSIMHWPWAQTSNYHWFIDCLPRLYLILQSIQQPINLIVPANIPSFQSETLHFLISGVNNIELVKIKHNEKWHLSTFILPSFVSGNSSGYLPLDIADFLRKNIWSGYQVKDHTPKKRLYISRRKATKRRIINEAEVLKVLKNYAIEEVFAEDLTYAQQVQLFYNAELVVAPHGAGLTNILFCFKTTILEIHPANIIKPHYFMLSKSLGFNYYYSIGSPSEQALHFKADIENINVILSQINN